MITRESNGFYGNPDDVIHALISNSIVSLYADVSGEYARVVIQNMIDKSKSYNLEDVPTKLKRKRIKRSLVKAINIDRINDLDFSQLRQEQLEDLGVSLYLKEIYGLRTAKNQSLDTSSSLKISNVHSDVYLRDTPTYAQCLFEKLHENKLLVDRNYKDFNEQTDDFKYFYVNSTLIKRKIELFKNLGPTNPDIKFRPLSDCIYRIRVANGTLKTANLYCKDARKSPFTTFMHYLGATPSSYQALKELHLTEHKSPDTENNISLLSSLFETEDLKTIEKISNTEDYSLRYVYRVVCSLVKGLSKHQAKDKFNNSIAIKTALQSIKNLISLFGISKKDTANSTKLSSLLMDEIFMIISIIRPYTNNDFNEIVARIYKERIPILSFLDPNNLVTCIESSGMGAISTAFAAAIEGYNNLYEIELINNEVDYFEIPALIDLFNNEENVLPRMTIFYTTLNPSTPKKHTDIDKIIDTVVNKVKILPDIPGSILFVTLIIDITIEFNKGKDSQLNEIITGLLDELLAGKVNIILAKSYQKYAALGSAKMMSGLVMAINNGDLRFQKSNAFFEIVARDSNFIQLDENQVMTYFLDTASELEIDLTKKASVNAKFVNELWLTSELSNNYYLDDLPFVCRWIPLLSASGGDPKVILNRLGLEYRDSFSFLNSSYLKVLTEKDDFYRFTIGQESHKTLTEKFYAIGFIVKNFDTGPYEYGQQGQKYLKNSNEFRIIKEEISRIIMDHSVDFKYNKIASLLNLVYILNTESLSRTIGTKFFKDEEQAINAEYSFFLSIQENPLEFLSIEMKETILLNWLKLNMNAQFNNDNITLIKNRCADIHTNKRVLLYMNDVPETFFSGNILTEINKKKLTKCMLDGLDFDTALFVCQELIKKGTHIKVKYVYQLITDKLIIYKLTQGSLTEMQKIEDNQSLPLTFPPGLTVKLIGVQDYPYKSEIEFWGAVRGAARDRETGKEIELDENQKEGILKLAKSRLNENVVMSEGLLIEDITQPLLTKSWQEVIDVIQYKALSENERIVNEYNQHCRSRLNVRGYDKQSDAYRSELMAKLKKNMCETNNINVFVNNFGAEFKLDGYLKVNANKRFVSA